MRNTPLHRQLGLTDGERDRIVELLEREPNHFELAVFSLLWSEHCGYKHSALLLKRLPSDGPHVLQGPGENAGVLDLGDGLAVAFKVESHNHPSAVEPFQGAATGVGGILRDISAMGARPIALLDGLRFGEPDAHFSRAVGGIGHYGNCTGVPNVGGEVVFDDSYASNCLVNAMCVGLLPTDRLVRAKATVAGALVVLYGATTGRDGIGGASVLASAELGEEDADKRPTVQVGDPFTGKRLIEVSVELVERGLVLSLQDCGAAGLASSLSEMAADYGIDVHLEQVPQRETGMEPWEVMISESQERMVAIVAPGRLGEVEAVIDRWELHRAVIGEVTDTGVLRCLWDGDVVGAIPAAFLTDACPRYVVEQCPRPAQPEEPFPVPAAREAVLELLASPQLRSRSFVTRRYDQLVQSRTVRRPGLDAAVLRLRPSDRGLAVTLDGQGRIGTLDPRLGGMLAVLEAARNVACVGADPIGLTDCLNFGNPEKPEIGWELAESIEGMALAAEALGIPVVSGNVSLYNDTDGTSIHPTPVVGCVGVLADVRRVPRGWRDGDAILLVRSSSPLTFAGSEAQARWGALGGRPALDLASEVALVRHLRDVAPRASLVHDVAEGGLAIALAEAALWSGFGARLDLEDHPLTLLGEIGGQAIVALPRAGRGRPDRIGARGAPDRHGGWRHAARRARSTSSVARSTGRALAMCGVFGIRSTERDVARLTYFGLFALQHRGQESAGIAVSEGGRVTALREMGLVSQVFDEEKLSALPGEVAIGHTRYSTTGGAHWSNAQPLVHHGKVRTVAFGHNGNLVDPGPLRDELIGDGVRLTSTSDTEVIAALLGRDPAPLPEAVAATMRRLEGAYSVVAISDGVLVAFRDPHGIRPLTLGRIGDDWVVASESCALELVGADVVRDVLAGEVVWVDDDGLQSVQAVPAGPSALCVFEHVYFARPDSRLGGTEVHAARARDGAGVWPTRRPSRPTS